MKGQEITPTKENKMFRKAKSPASANNSFLLSFGLINIPLSVYSGVEATRVERKEFVDGDLDHPVGRLAYDKTTGEPVELAHIVRKAEASDGTWVTLSDEEIAAVTMPKGVAEVISFVKLTDLTKCYLTESVSQVRPKTSGLKKAQITAADKAFGLFLSALKARKVAAIVKVALRGPARYAAITPNGDLLFLYTSDAIRQERPLPATNVKSSEIDMALLLIDTIGVGTPELVDDTAEVVQAFVDTKAAGTEPTVERAEAPESFDVIEALRKSIEAAKANTGHRQAVAS